MALANSILLAFIVAIVITLAFRRPNRQNSRAVRARTIHHKQDRSKVSGHQLGQPAGRCARRGSEGSGACVEVADAGLSKQLITGHAVPASACASAGNSNAELPVPRASGCVHDAASAEAGGDSIVATSSTVSAPVFHADELTTRTATVEVSCWLQVRSAAAAKEVQRETQVPLGRYCSTAPFTVRNPATSIARRPRTPKPLSPPLPSLPPPPRSPTSSLRPIRRTVSATLCTPNGQGVRAGPFSPASVLTLAAEFEGRCGSADCSPWLSPLISRTPSSCSLLPACSIGAASLGGASYTGKEKSCSSPSPPWTSSTGVKVALGSRRNSSGGGVGAGDSVRKGNGAGGSRSGGGSSDSGSGDSGGCSGDSGAHRSLCRGAASATFLRFARVTQRGTASPARGSLPGLSSSPPSYKRLMKPNMPNILGL